MQDCEFVYCNSNTLKQSTVLHNRLSLSISTSVPQVSDAKLKKTRSRFFVCRNSWFCQFIREVLFGSTEKKHCCHGYLQLKVPFRLFGAPAGPLIDSCQPIRNKKHQKYFIM